jgi:hypothetical protein
LISYTPEIKRLAKTMEQTLEIKTTQITWRQKRMATYAVIVITDGKQEWSKNYDNALDAVNSYNLFVDHGFCLSERVISLVEPNGKIHTKIFEYPLASVIH